MNKLSVTSEYFKFSFPCTCLR